jgi:hypothetical protein
MQNPIEVIDSEQETVEDCIAFVFDIVRDDATWLAKFDLAFRQRYGYDNPQKPPSAAA